MALTAKFITTIANHMRRKILYLTWGEDLATSGILENQVINQLIATRRVAPEISYHYLCAMPIFWKLRHTQARQILDEKISRLQAADITSEVFYYWLPVRARHIAIVAYKLLQPLFYFWFLRIRNVCRTNEIDIIHTRAYTGGVVCATAIEFLKIRTPFVFDTRGLYVDEIIQLGFLKANSWWHRLWQEAERRTYHTAAMVINVSEPFSQHVQETFSLPRDRVATIYTSVDTKIFRPSRDSVVERKMRLAKKAPVLVYCGDLGGNSWHSAISLFAIFNLIRKLYPLVTLKIVSSATPNVIRQELADAYIDAVDMLSQTSFQRTYTASETAQLLASADIAIFSYHELRENVPRYLSNVVIASKTGEYLASGLPVIVNSTARAAASVIVTTNSGMSYDLRETINFKQDLEKIVKKWLTYSKQARKSAELLFSSEANARKYYEIYKRFGPITS
ncbi:MAG: glycosyltransferase [Spirochaetes bacterium]|nr:glycosyltransferase [Spirochaetota bacterium]